MTTCNYSEKLGAYHDGELDQSARMALEIHISHCPTCAAELASLKAMSQLLSVAQPHLSQMSLHRVHNRAQAAMDEGLLHIARFISGIAAAVLIAASAGLFYRSSQMTMSQHVPAVPVNTEAVAISDVVPPWVEVPVTTDSDSSAIVAASPAAEWYLTDAGSGGN